MHVHHSAKKMSQNHEGSLLVIALIILAAIALSTIYLSLVLLNEIRNTRYADNGIISHYSAESGLERSLWRLKLSKKGACTLNLSISCTIDSDCNPVATNGICGTSVFFSSLNGLVDQCAAEDGGVADRCVPRCSGGATPGKKCSDNADCGTGTCLTALGDPERLYSYTSAVISSGDFTTYNIMRNAPVFTDIYDPTKEGQASVDTGISQLNIDWYVSDCSPQTASAKLEITYTPISAQSLQPEQPVTQIDVCGCVDPASKDTATGHFRCASDLVPTNNSVNIAVNSSKFYRISFRSLDVPVKKIVMVTNSVSIPSQVEVKASGTYRESETRVSVRTLWKDVLSGIFNYVVFSEESLIKDTKTITTLAYGSMCGFCSDSTSSVPRPCSSNADCTSPATCSIANSSTDTIDAAASQAFCSEAIGAETTVPPSVAINQTNENSCNLSCNGRTFCGDGTRQQPNGAGDGANSGNEECDLGAGNSDIVALTCRKNCLNPFCGDGVTDNGTFNGITYSEQCDDPTNTNVCEPDPPLSPGNLGKCTLTFCGDGRVQNPNGSNVAEQCDDPAGNGACPKTCSTACTTNVC